MVLTLTQYGHTSVLSKTVCGRDTAQSVLAAQNCLSINPFSRKYAPTMSEQDSPTPQRRSRRRRTQLPDDAPEVASPCVSVCVMDQQSGVCTGCYRTLNEIATWGRLPNQQRWEIVQSLHERRKKFKPAD